MVSKCTHNGIQMYAQWYPNVRTMVSKCTHNGIQMYAQWYPNVRTMVSKCTHNGIQMYAQWYPNVRTMVSKCTHNGIQMYAQWYPNVRTMVSKCTHNGSCMHVQLPHLLPGTRSAHPVHAHVCALPYECVLPTGFRYCRALSGAMSECRVCLSCRAIYLKTAEKMNKSSSGII